MSWLAIDFGGTRTRAAWFDDALQLVSREEIPSQVYDPQEQVFGRIIDLARQVIPSGQAVKAVGVSAPGPLDIERGIILHALTLPGWKNVPLASLLSEALNAPVWVNNDANLGALAEAYHGAGQGADPMIYLTISTGIGGGAVVDGRLFTGWGGLAIEPGHMLMTAMDGSLQRLEDLASGTALGKRAIEKLQISDQPSRLRHQDYIDGRAVGEAARTGDSLALEIVRSAGHYLGIGFVNLLHLFNPQAIVIGGSVSNNVWDLLMAEAVPVIRDYVLAEHFYRDDLIRPAQLGDDVCLVGAAVYAHQKMNDSG